MKRSLSLFLFMLCCLSCAHADSKELPIVVVIPSYNNLEWYKRNLDSLLVQDYTNYRVLYVDDCSSDGTAQAVEKYLKKLGVTFNTILFDERNFESHEEATAAFSKAVNEKKSPFTLVKNIHRSGALANLYRMIHSCKPEEIIATLDGDDMLYHDQVLRKLDAVYQQEDVWFTHGCLIEYPWGHVSWSEPVKPEIIASRSFRSVKCPSHMRTFYTWIFKKIAVEDFLYEGKFYPMAWDMAIMFPLLEMAGERHAYIEDVNYVYNMANHMNDNKVDPSLQNLLDKVIRGKPSYQRLERSEL